MRKWLGKAYRSPTGYRHDPGQTAADVVRYEQEELGNELGVSPSVLKQLEKYPAHQLVWVTRSRRMAAHYGSPQEVDVVGARVVAEDGDGGYLVLVTRRGVRGGARTRGRGRRNGKSTRLIGSGTAMSTMKIMRQRR